jgi:dTDP-4-dehydrorhamnose reductase
MMTRILITGGTGYLGRALIRAARDQGYEVAATYYSQAPLVDEQITWIPLDVRDPLAVEEACDRYRPEGIVHTAFRQHEPDLYTVTADGTRAIAQSAGSIGARLIHMSSDVIFDGESPEAYRESDPPAPITEYGRAKADAELFVQTAAPQATIVRTSLIYGIHAIDRHTRFVLELIAGLQVGQLFDDEIRCPILVDDLVAALLELLSLDYAGILNIAGADALSRYQFGSLLATYHGYDATLLQPGRSSAQAVRRPRNCRLNIEQARALLQTPLRGASEILGTNY